jgi:hypothetical protein
MKNILSWLRYSGAVISVSINPVHWVWWPRVYRESDLEWPEGMRRTYRASFLMLTMRVWLDDGSW